MLAWDQLRPLVLRSVGGEVVAADLRDRLAGAGVTLSPLVFHGMLAALERAGLVSGRYDAGEPVTAGPERRRYRLTPAGSDLIAEAASGRREAA